MNCVVITPDGEERFEKCASLLLPSVLGPTMLQPGHTEAYFVLAEGEAVLEAEGGERRFPVADGFCRIIDDEATLIIRDAGETGN